MRRSNYVCFEHRFVARNAHARPRCPVDGREMTWTGDRWRVPKRDDDDGWAEFEAYATKLWTRIRLGYNWRVEVAKELRRRWGG